MNRYQVIRKMVENPIIRLCAYPLLYIKHKAARERYINSEYPKKIEKIRNMHLGKRCFIVGNGPSLKREYLDVLHEHNEICFGMNHIYDLFDRTKWRPNFYFCFDRDFIRAEYKAITELDVDNIFIEYSKAPKIRAEKDNVYYYFSDYVFSVKRGCAITDHVCTELQKEASFVTNTTHLCIEFALYMGFKEIYLLGIDHDYSFGYGKNHAEGISEGKHNDDKVFCNSDMGVAITKYKQYADFAKQNGTTILNATDGGKLEVFKRINFGELMYDGKK